MMKAQKDDSQSGRHSETKTEKEISANTKMQDNG